ncbi:MAG TPA: DUF2283 domain-containing protein [Herpetosiphonaceae bacterium]
MRTFIVVSFCDYFDCTHVWGCLHDSCDNRSMNYDEESDTLYVSFAPGEAATGIELNQHILLRIKKQERRATGLTLFDYSVLAQQTDIGPRSFSLTGLAELSPELRALVIEILRAEPVRTILALSVDWPSPLEIIPITSLQPIAMFKSAA